MLEIEALVMNALSYAALALLAACVIVPVVDYIARPWKGK